MSTSDSDRVFELAAELFGLLSAPIRLRIVCELLEGEQNVGQLAERVGASQPNLSQHLATLYRCGILARRRAGSQVWYRLANQRVEVLCEAVRDRSAARPDAAGPHRSEREAETEREKE